MKGWRSGDRAASGAAYALIRGSRTTALLLLVSAACAASASGSTGFQAGAARVETPPPAYSASQDAQAFPGCNTQVFNGPRQFAFEEPYVDTDGSGDFGYLPSGGDALAPEPFCDANGNG